MMNGALLSLVICQSNGCFGVRRGAKCSGKVENLSVLPYFILVSPSKMTVYNPYRLHIPGQVGWYLANILQKSYSTVAELHSKKYLS